MKNKNLFILPAIALAISLAFANATYASTTSNSADGAKPLPCCCKKCDCQDCKCPCNDGHCQTCKDHFRLNFGHFFCKCCKHQVNS